jgi:uncharacterized surface protein with fasciclin (FAS1) repeats
MTVAAALALFAATPAFAGHCNSSAAHAHADKPSIVETAVSSDDFETLTAALTSAGLVEALSGEGPFTVFAPTDEAFAKLPKGTVESLLKPENKAELVRILSYHVVAGNMPAAKVVKKSGADTLAGPRLAFVVSDEGVKVGDANVIQTDLECSNGVIHVIDTVLLPPAETVVGSASADRMSEVSTY